MKPVVVTNFPGQKVFVGTFDMEAFKEWWVSESLPVTEIVDVDWAYAQYHVCVGKLPNGTYSIFQSPDYGMHWNEVLNLSEIIYCVVRIDYGWLVASTSTGWYESTNSGKDWAKISSQAPGCKNVVNIGENILVAHDGYNIWRSTDIAQNWTKTLDGTNMHLKAVHGGFYWRSYSGDSYPALDGYGAQVFAGIGPYLVMSDDEAITWTMPWGWDGGYTSGNKSIAPYYWSHRILQVIHTDSLPDPSFPGTAYSQYINTWMIRVYIPQLNIVRCLVSNGGDFNYYAKFDQEFTGYNSSKLSTYRVLKPGSTEEDKIVVGPMDKAEFGFSLDGGWKWTKVDPNSVTVYFGDPTQEMTAPNPFIEEDFSQWYYTGHPCHNYGKYYKVDGKMQRALSWDIDWLLKKTVPTTWETGTSIAERMDKTYQLDYSTLNIFDKEYDHDLLTKIVRNKIYSAHNITRKTFDEEFNVGLPLAGRLIKEYTSDYVAKLIIDTTRRFDVLLFGTVDIGGGFDVILVSDQTSELLLDFAKYTTQWWNICDPNWPSDVYDSRRDEID